MGRGAILWQGIGMVLMVTMYCNWIGKHQIKC